MNKYEIKMLHSQDIGRSLATQLENAKTRIIKLEGACEYTTLSQNSILSVISALQQQDATDEITPEMRNFAMTYLKKALGGIQSVMIKAEQEKLRTEGRIAGLETAFDVVEKSFKTEEAKYQGLVSAVENGKVEVEERRPQPTLKNQRLGE